MPVRVVVKNTTGHELDLVQCGGPFQLLLESERVHPQPAFAMCALPLKVPKGRSTYDTTLVASYSSCTNDPSSVGYVACLPDGRIPPLPPGRYHARLYQQPTVGESPMPLQIRVTPDRLPTTTTTTSPYDRYNPTHDPTRCVRVNPDGSVSYAVVTPTPSYDPTKMDPRIYGKCG